MASKLIFTPFGGVGKVTGANFHFKAENGSFLVDCGLVQGGSFCEDENYKPFPYDVASVDALLVTHAHLDHIGRIPKLIKEGFKGKIYSTPQTKSLAEIMFEDALSIFGSESRSSNKDPLYEAKHVAEALSLWEGVSYHQEKELFKGVSFYLKDAGHILGSAMIEIRIEKGKLICTGDLGNSPSALLKSTEEVEDADYLLMESVYGDRNHPSKEERDHHFAMALERTIKRGGTVVIPAFSIERTQNILYALNNLIEEKKLQSVPVFLDSPLAIRVTDIYKQNKDLFNDEIISEIKNGDDIFHFPKLTFSVTRGDSDGIERVRGAKIILAGSGMSAGGRVTKHEIEYLPDSKNCILLVGYQAVGTVGRLLEEGQKKVSINGVNVSVKAEIISIQGFSSHMDGEGLFSFVEKSQKKLKKVFVAMGEPKSSLFLVQRLRDYLGVDALYPEPGKSYELLF